MQKLTLLHGALGSSSQIKSLTELLKLKFEVFSFDFSGHGYSWFMKDFSLNNFTEEVISFIKMNNIKIKFL